MAQVQLNNFKMHYVEQGTGSEPIVLVHGFISTQLWWQPTLERLPDNFHAYAIDLRACGESEQIETGHTLVQYADDLHQFVEQVSLQKFILVGHSMGGGVAMQYALNHQDRLKALMLVDPLAPYGMRIPPDITAWINAQQGNPEGIRQILLAAFATPPSGEYMEKLVEYGARWNKSIYLGTMDDMARFNISDRLSEIQVPTLVTWGDKDTVVPFAGVADIFTKIAGCGLEVWHGVGHSGPIEIPDRFVELLTRFVNEVNAVVMAIQAS
jgi:branched-chain amino acid transport system permease protein